MLARMAAGAVSLKPSLLAAAWLRMPFKLIGTL